MQPALPMELAGSTTFHPPRDTYANDSASAEAHSPPSQRKPSAAEESHAAQTIQRNYRGYRQRREIDGLGLDSSQRWDEALKEIRYRNLTRPRPHQEKSGTLSSSENTLSTTSTANRGFAQSEWNRLRQIAQRAHNDDTSDEEGEASMTSAENEEHRRKRREAKRKREQNAKEMGLEYWLEMVDQRHRYGSHLRSYHAVWKASDTHDNFFYWLDEGDGKTIDAPTCSREVLDRDEVRYLSREERQQYLVKIDKKGRLQWAKNDQLVNTSYQFKDSLKGIVPANDKTPAYRQDTRYPGKHPSTTDNDISSSDSGEHSDADGAHYVNQELSDAKGVRKVQYISAAALLNHLLQSTTKKNTWIFVADTSFRLYIGIKQSGAFQHSSFLHGARISAAGLIKVKNGQLRSLSPLSGHYRPPTSAFRAFVHSMKEEGADMSHVSISKSYAVLLGLESYLGTKKRAKNSVKHLERQFEKVLRPDEARKRAEADQDKSESARKEREWLAKQKAEKRESSFSVRGTLGMKRPSDPGSTNSGSLEHGR